LASSSSISYFSASRSAALSSPVIFVFDELPFDEAFPPFYVLFSGVEVFGCMSGKPAGAVVPSFGVVMFS
jgi:hypothetical protein